jgi:hypothetical protein
MDSTAATFTSMGPVKLFCVSRMLLYRFVFVCEHARGEWVR